MYVLILTQNVLGYILGDFFHKFIRPPCSIPILLHIFLAPFDCRGGDRKILIEEVIRVKERSCGSELRENKRKTKRSRGSLK
jgi:hypothetical protein